MKYKGYTARVELDESGEFFHGQVLGLLDVITFQGSSAEELQREFCKSVDVYLEYCEELGRKPDKQYSGSFVLRLKPDMHRDVSIAAASSDQSVNHFVVECIERVLEEQPTA